MGEKKIEISTLTEKYQATIPASVRKQLGLSKGDKVVFERKGNLVVIKKATSSDLDYLKSLSSQMSEWASQEDEEAYHDL